MPRPGLSPRPAAARDQSWSLVSSLAVHLTILGLLSVMVLPAPQGSSGGTVLHGELIDTALDDDVFEAPDLNLDADEPSSDAGALASPVVVAAESAAPLPRVELAARLPMDFHVAELGALNVQVREGPTGLGESGAGPGEGGAGGGGSGPGFFGIQVERRRTVFVVDGSRSMNMPHPGIAKTRFGQVKLELLHTIGQMNPEQQFYIVFFSDLAVPMPASRLVEASAEAKEYYLTWMAQLAADGNTQPGQALLLALALQPDVIYFLTDGRFDAAIVGQVRVTNRSNIPINTIGFGDNIGEDLLKRIAEQSGGTYKFIPATPEIVRSEGQEVSAAAAPLPAGTPSP